MGMGMNVIEFFNRAIALTLADIRGLRMAELGDQKLWAMIACKPNGDRIWAKDWFEQRGCHHYSIDIHGKNGSHPIDLSKPIEDPFWQGRFDIVTNFGTSEHVADQWECWRNIHNLGRPGCVYVHVLPEFGRYSPDHCENYYTAEFFDALCKKCRYTKILNESILALGHVGACYIKPVLGPFSPAKQEIDTWIHRKLQQ